MLVSTCVGPASRRALAESARADRGTGRGHRGQVTGLLVSNVMLGIASCNSRLVAHKGRLGMGDSERVDVQVSDMTRLNQTDVGL